MNTKLFKIIGVNMVVFVLVLFVLGFARQGTKKRTSSLSDLLYLLKTTKKWWLLPFLIALIAYGALMLVTSTAVAPFVYTIF